MLKVLLILLITAFAILVIGGFFLPNKYDYERSALIDATDQELYDTLASTRTWREWSAWSAKRDPSATFVDEGQERGPGALTRWTGTPEGLGVGSIRIVAATPPKSIDYELAFGGGKFVMTGAIRMEPDPRGTRVTWTARGSVGVKPFGGWVLVVAGSAFEHMVGDDLETSLASLRAYAAAR